MSKTKTNSFTTQRTYRFSEICRLLIDQLSILLPGISKEDLANFAVFWMATSFKELIENKELSIEMVNESEKIRIADAMDVMQQKMAECGYENVMSAITKTKGYTRLDRFFDLDEGEEK